MLLIVAGCGGRPPAEPRHLVLISIDTLRADRLGCYGYERDTSPAIDSLARGGALFENVVAESPWTLPSHVTMLTGLAPDVHGVVRPEFALGEDTVLLAEVLADAGLRTWAGTEGGFVGRRHGFARGFERFDDQQSGFLQTLADARNFLAKLAPEERAFLFLHTFAVHCPYEASEELEQRFHSPDAEFIETDGRCGNPDYNQLELSPAQVLHVSDRYDAGLAQADAQLGEFLTWLEAQPFGRETLIVVTSDHGEELLGEHGQIGHERSLHAELLLVPWIVSGPGVEPGRIQEAVGLSEVAPTLLQLLKVSPADTPLALEIGGVSAARRVRGEKIGPRLGGARHSSLAWQAELRSVFHDGHHLIEERSADSVIGKRALFSIGDPGERVDLSAQRPDKAADLSHLIDRQMASTRARAVAPIPELTESERERLRALGYFE